MMRHLLKFNLKLYSRFLNSPILKMIKMQIHKVHLKILRIIKMIRMLRIKMMQIYKTLTIMMLKILMM